jgi:hypothetical protein
MVEPAMEQDNGPMKVLPKPLSFRCSGGWDYSSQWQLPPAASHPDVSSAAKDPAAAKPQGSPVRGQNPDARRPNPSVAVPIIISGCVSVIRPWRRRGNLSGRRRRRHRGGHSRSWRWFLNGPRRRSLRGSRPRWECGVTPFDWGRGDVNWLLGRGATARDQSGQGGQRPN